jgi:hypothetical protein
MSYLIVSIVQSQHAIVGWVLMESILTFPIPIHGQDLILLPATPAVVHLLMMVEVVVVMLAGEAESGCSCCRSRCIPNPGIHCRF